jgi:hypothetical protein
VNVKINVVNVMQFEKGDLSDGEVDELKEEEIIYLIHK